MKRAVERLLKRWGNRMTVSFASGEQVECCAWIQPLQQKKLPVSDEIGVLQGGYDSDACFYVGPASCRVDQAMVGTTILEQGSGRAYRVARAHCVLLKNEPVYVWAVLTKEIA